MGSTGSSHATLVPFHVCTTAGFASWSAECPGPHTARRVVSKYREEVAWLIFLPSPESTSLSLSELA